MLDLQNEDGSTKQCGGSLSTPARQKGLHATISLLPEAVIATHENVVVVNLSLSLVKQRPVKDEVPVV